MAKQAWFESWFDSPYYHILYKNRSYTEAAAFLDRLVEYLNPAKDAMMLDVGCGNGRHAIHLAKKGFVVLGTDLSANNIKQAKTEAAELQLTNATFIQRDMRKTMGLPFNYVFNLFTSFGYFNSDADNLKVIEAFAFSLTINGLLVIDFLNAPFVKKHLVEKESKVLEEIEFKIHRKIDDGRVIKQINFKAGDDEYNFEESVQLLELDDFKRYVKQVGLEVQEVFGNYQLEPYQEEKSERLIMIIKALD